MRTEAPPHQIRRRTVGRAAAVGCHLRVACQVLQLERRFLCSAEDAPGRPDGSPAIAVPLQSSTRPAQSAAAPVPTVLAGIGLPLVAPLLRSDPAAPAKLYLNFTGAPAMNWEGSSVPATPAYDTNGNPTTFSAAELANIRQIWSRVAEKFSPFNLDVTTVDPGAYGQRNALRVVIGGNGAWTGGTYGGYSVVGSFTGPDATVWVFPQNLNDGDPKDTAEAVAHECGHAFGLLEQAAYSGTIKTSDYNTGDALTAPIMGSSYGAQRGIWWRGPDSNSASEIQDDMAMIAGPVNGFGYRPEDHGQTPAAADALIPSGRLLSGSGIIATTADTDFFSFTTSAGSVSFNASVNPDGPTLHLLLALFDGSGKAVATSDTSTLGQTLTATVPAGTYFVEAASHGGYGDVGQYTITGTAATAAAQPIPPTTLLSLDAEPIGDRVELTWSRSGTRGSFMIEKSSDDRRTWTVLATPSGRTTHYIDSAVQRGTPYSYRCVGFGRDGSSGVVTLLVPRRGTGRSHHRPLVPHPRPRLRHFRDDAPHPAPASSGAKRQIL